MAVAVEGRRVVGRVVRRRRADGHPAGAGVVVRVAGVARDRAAGRRPGGAVAVGVEVEVVQELVAPAVVVVRVVLGGRAEAGAAGLKARIQERARSVEARLVAGGRGAVAVQVPAHRVQLPQRRDVDQPVAVGVVVGALESGIEFAVLQRRVVVGRAEVPNVVDGAVVVDVVIIPVGVYAAVAQLSLQVRRGLASVVADLVEVPQPGGHRAVPVGVCDGLLGAAHDAVKPAGAGRPGVRRDGVAGAYRAVVVVGHEASHEGIGAGAFGVQMGAADVAVDDRAWIVVSHETAHVVRRSWAGAPYAAAQDVASADRALVDGGQGAYVHVAVAVDVRIDQPQSGHPATAPHAREETDVVVAGSIHSHVGDGVSVALKGRGVGAHVGVRIAGQLADGNPAGVGVRIVRVHVAVAVRVEVEIRRELVAGAVAGRVRVGVRATHVLRRHRAREGRGVARLVAGGRRAIAV